MVLDTSIREIWHLGNPDYYSSVDQVIGCGMGMV